MWQELLGYVKQNPILGYGYNSFWDPPRHIELMTGIGWVPYHAHSEYIELLLDLGTTGLLLYLFIMAFAMKRSLMYYRLTANRGYGFCFILLTFCVVRGVLEPTIVMPTLLTFTIMWGIVYVAFTNKTHEEGTFLKRKTHDATDKRKSVHI